MRRFVAVGLGVAMVAGCAGGEDLQQTPEDAANAVAAALSTGSLDEIKVRQGDPGADLPILLEGMNGMLPEVTVAHLSPAAQVANLKLDYEWPLSSPWTYQADAVLVRVDNTWELNWAPSVLHPKLTETTRLERQRGEARLTGRITARACTEARVEQLKAKRRAAPGASDRDPALVGGIFERLIRDRGWSTPVAVGSVLTRWAELVGPEIALHCRPESFENSVVRVRTSSTAWATQLRLMVPHLLDRFDAELGSGVVTRIEVAGPAAPSWRKGPRTVRGGRGPRDTYG
ncbi:MAG: DciA family protein [Propionibacteriaceae bacterium]|nr:DciA family protein [Propionibacteriaceae bacterium]